MLFLLSPAKTLDYTTPVAPEVASWASQPQFISQAAELIDVLRDLDASDIASLMNLSGELALLNHGRYEAWTADEARALTKPAALAFNGDVYEGLRAASLTLQQLLWAQSQLVILSGLYGALRPLDHLQAYRLEMGTRLRTVHGNSLYDFWGDTVTRHLNERQMDEAHPVVVNLASQEYSRVALRKTLRAKVIECVFEDFKDGRYKVISFYAKRARGLMARWAVEHAVTQPQELVLFSAEGYAHQSGLGEAGQMVFRRKLER